MMVSNPLNLNSIVQESSMCMWKNVCTMLHPQDLLLWSYRGEGGANLVISLPHKRLIVRFVKTKYADKGFQIDEKIEEMSYFANNVMRPLLGYKFVRPLSIGIISEDQFNSIKAQVQIERPRVRRKRKDIERGLGKVILSHDCALHLNDNVCYDNSFNSPTFSFEIKPKQGWHFSDATSESSVELCLRCMKQEAKYRENEIPDISSYCPLDLFSFDLTRMKRALFHLMSEPCNRFKMFKDGVIVFTDSIGDHETFRKELQDLLVGGGDTHENDCLNKESIDLNRDIFFHRLSALLISCLLYPMDEHVNQRIMNPVSNGHTKVSTSTDMESANEVHFSKTGPQKPKHVGIVLEDVVDNMKYKEKKTSTDDLDQDVTKVKGCDPSAEELPDGCVLQRILALQKLTASILNERDAEVLCQQIIRDPSNTIRNLDELNKLVSWRNLQTAGRSMNNTDSRDIVGGGISQQNSSSSVLLESRIHLLRQFLIAATAKDVSIMITVKKEPTSEMRRMHESDDVYMFFTSVGSLFRIQISVIDLDPKPVSRISTWAKRKDDWIKTYVQVCSDNSEDRN